MVIQGQTFNDNYVHSPQYLNQSTSSIPPLNYYLQSNNLVLNNYQSPTMEKSTTNLTTRPSFYIDDLLGTTKATINRENYQSNYMNTTTTSTLDSSSSSTPNIRHRTRFSQEQKQILERVFSHTQHIVGQKRAALSMLLGLSPTQVRVWFQNRRIKQRKMIEMLATAASYELPKQLKVGNTDNHQVTHGGNFYVQGKQPNTYSNQSLNLSTN